MYKIDYRNAKKSSSFGLPFVVVGMLFLIVFGYAMFGGMIRKTKMDATVEAYNVVVNSHTDSDGNLLYRPTYYYKVNNVQYQYTPSYSTNVGVSKMNDTTIYYNSKNPNDAVAEFESSFNFIYIMIFLFICIFPIVGLKDMKKGRERIKLMKKLETDGTLIKNLKYRMLPTGYSVNNGTIMAIEVDYELPSGSIVTLTGEPRFDRKFKDNDGLVDLLIDLNNPDNYYIDFNIEELAY